MAGEKHNLQDTFLNNVRKEKNPVTVFLVNGVKLQGVITWFDNFCVLLISLLIHQSHTSYQMLQL